MTESQPIELKITINPDGVVYVQGPLNDPILCYGMLKMGERQLDKHFDQSRKVRAIEVVPNIPKIREN